MSLLEPHKTSHSLVNPQRLYRYSTLNDDEIRLLKILPGNKNQEVSVEILHFQLPNCDCVIDHVAKKICSICKDGTLQPPSYEALSYAWGNVALEHAINNTSGEKIFITSTCQAALTRLRLRDHTKLVWIDAICINQEDNHERSSQIKAMSRIYRAASNVIIYLGDEADNSDLAMDLILKSEERHQSFYLYTPTESESSSLRNFLLRPWFHRVWVIQEVYWSWNATVLCGSRSFPWSRFKPFLYDPWLAFGIYSLRNGYGNPWYPFLFTLLQGSLVTGPYSIEQLFSLLCKTRHSLSTDPRDKVFALLPLFSLNNSNCPLADYSVPTIALFTTLATSFIRVVGLETLLAACGDSNLNDLPSWVPDWASTPSSGNLLDIAFQHPFPRASSIRPLFCASGSRPDSSNYSVTATSGECGSSTSLQINVVLVDEIHTLGDVIISENTSKRYFNTEAFTTWPQIVAKFSRCFPTAVPDPLVTYYKMAMMMSEREASDWELESTEVKAWLAKPTGRPKLGAHPIRSLRSVHDRMVASTRGRRLFITRSGYMGLSPPKTHIGDNVFLLEGLSVPVVLRESARGLKLVGEAYVQGIMHGEYLQQFRSAGRDGGMTSELPPWQSKTLV